MRPVPEGGSAIRAGIGSDASVAALPGGGFLVGDAGTVLRVDAQGRIQLHYRPNNVKAHKRLVAETKRILRRLGYWLVVTHSHGSTNTTHQCGTLCFGTDPRTSVLDPYCRAHDVGNLFVVDASFFPSSAAVNPGLTIAAQALRVADHIRDTEL